jgi:hypothetical protein
MNERINELRLKAGISRLHDEPKVMVAVSEEGKVIEPLDGLEKFAELIIRDCYVALHPMLRDMISRGQAYDMIQQHFGVEK